MSSPEHFDTTPLQQPLPLAPDLTLANRLILSSLTRNRSESAPAFGVPNDWMVEYYRQRARGGFGLLLSEGTLVEPGASSPSDSLVSHRRMERLTMIPFCSKGTEWRDAPGIWNDAQVEGWKRVVDAVHEEGGKIFCQLWHVGRVARPDQPEQITFAKPVRSPSTIGARGGRFHDLPNKPGYLPPTEPLSDPRELLPDYRQAAINAQKAGFDGVDVHAANGYLIVQFLDRGVNDRTDEWGGSVENRCRFAREVLKTVVDVWGAERVGVKISPVGGYNDVGMNAIDTYETYSHLMSIISDLHLAYVQPVHYLPHEDKELDPREGKRARCQDFDVQSRLIQPMRDAQEIDGRERKTLVFWNGLFGGEKYGGEKASEWVKDGRADAVVFGRDTITNPDLPFRIFNHIELTSPGGGNSKLWYGSATGPDGKGVGLITDVFCEKFMREKGEGKVRARVGELLN